MKRRSFTVIFHHTCEPNRDARNFALDVMRWWRPDVDAVQRAILEQRWTESIRPLMAQCWKTGTDMEIHVSMHGADPSLRIVRVFKPDHHPRTQ